MAPLNTASKLVTSHHAECVIELLYQANQLDLQGVAAVGSLVALYRALDPAPICVTRNGKDLVFQPHEGRLATGQLALLSGVSAAAATGFVDRLAKKGLVERIRDEGLDSDRRMIFARLTPEAITSVEPLIQRMSSQG